MRVLAIAVALTAAVVAAETFSGDGTDYGGNVLGGACGFSKMWPAWTTESMGLTAAINSPQWNDALECGRCAKVWHGSNKPVIVQIVDKCPECKHGDLDFADAAYKAVMQSPPGREKISWEFVDCPSMFVKGDLTMRVKEGSNPNWLALNPNNFMSAIRGVDIKTGGSWTPMVHNDQTTVGLYYVYSGAVGSSFQVRAKGMNGQVLESPTFSSFSGDLKFGKQFSTSGTSGGDAGPSTAGGNNATTTPTTTTPAVTTAAPTQTTAPKTTQPPSTTSPSTTAPSTTSPSTTAPSTTATPSTTSPSTTATPSTTSPSTTSTPSTTSPSTTAPSTTAPSTTAPTPTKKPKKCRVRHTRRA